MNKMKKIIGLICFSLSQIGSLISQDMGLQRIMVAPYLSSNLKVSNEASAILIDKMTLALTNQGISASPFNSRFILTANVVVLSKDVLPSAPAMYSYELGITFYLGDGINGTKFCNLSRNVIGVSTSDSRSQVEAIKKLKLAGDDFNNFIGIGKKRIIDYYNNMCNTIINESRVLVSQNEFSRAIYKLMSVPDACSVCYDKCLTEVSSVYKKKINYECEGILNQAKNVWMSNMNYNGANQVGTLLNQIDPNASCFAQAQKLRDEIKVRLMQIDNREWNFKWETEIGLQRDAIKAARDIAVAYAENQPDLLIYSSTAYNIIGWW